jgi:putative transport protein
MTEIGLVFFLAKAGTVAGKQLLTTIAMYGPVTFVVGAVVTMVTITFVFIFARYVLKLDILESLGAVCGGMTSTPGLGVVLAKTDSDVPTISYAAAYPVALIFMTIFVQILVSVMGMF